MANEQNLIPGAHTLTREEVSKGGKRSGEKRRLQSAIRKALESKANSPELNELFKQFGIEEESRDYALAIACAITCKAAQGNLSAAEFIRNSIGEKPKEEIDLTGGVVIIDDVPCSD